MFLQAELQNKREKKNTQVYGLLNHAAQSWINETILIQLLWHVSFSFDKLLCFLCFLGNQTKCKIGIVYLRVGERVGQVGDEHSGRGVLGLGSRFASLLRCLLPSHLCVFCGVRDCESKRFWKTSLLRCLCVHIRGVFVVFGLGYVSFGPRVPILRR